MLGFVSFVVIFSVLVFVHELGHLLAAKACGVTVAEFGFGYPPRLLRLGAWRGTEITINALPFGGFVKMAEDDPTQPGSVANKKPAVRALVFSAGALMNALLAISLSTFTYLHGALTPVDGPGAGVYAVAQGSPAYEAGILPGDNILSLDGAAVTTVDQAVAIIRARVGQEMVVVLEREGQALPPVTVTPRVDPPPGEGALGVALDLPLRRTAYPLWRAVALGARSTLNIVRSMWYAIQSAIRGETAFEVSGPIGIYRMTVEVAKTGLERLIEFAALLSVNLFLLNLLPLPALDGGRLAFVLLEVVRGGRRIAPEKEGLVHAIGMMLLIGLMVAVAVVDYRRYLR